MKKNTYGVAAVVVKKRPYTVKYTTLFFAGMGGGVAQFYLSSRPPLSSQAAAIKVAQRMNGRSGGRR